MHRNKHRYLYCSGRRLLQQQRYIPYCLLQSVYTFFLGLLFAYSYICLKNIFVPIAMHFLFNFLNDVLVVELFNINYNLNFFLINIGIGLLLCIYGLILYKKVLKED